jgi:hypothetical protein
MDEGVGYPQKTYLNFVGAGVSLSVNDPNGSIDVTIPGATGGHVIQDEGTPLTARTALNFIGVGVTAADDAANNRTNVTITGAGQTPWTQDIWAANFNLGGVKGIGVGAGANPVIAAVYVQTAGSGVAGFRHFDSATTGAGSIIIGNDLGHLGGLIFGGSLLATTGLRDILSFYTQSATPIIFAPQEVERVRIAADGKVGIGCTPFSEQLEVRGDVRFKGPTSSTFLFIDTTGAAGSTAIFFQAAGVARGNITAGSTSVALSSNTYLSLQTGSTPAERVRITAAGLMGIGKTPSTYRLEVSGDIDITGVYRVNGTPIGTGAVASVFGRTGAIVATAGDYTAALVTNSVSTLGSYADPAWITSLAYAKITGAPAATGQTPWLTDINGNGKILYSVAAIGIQVASPQVALQIAGQIWSTADTVILEYAAHSAGYGRVGCMSFHPLTLWTNQLERLRVTADGKVGINHNNPSAQLDVVGTVRHSIPLPTPGVVFPGSSMTHAGSMVPVTAGNDYALHEVAVYAGNQIGLNTRVRGITTADTWSNVALGLSFDVDATIGAGGQLWFYQGYLGVKKNNPAYSLDIAGDCNVTGAFRINGVPLSTGGGSQTPWTSDIEAATFSLRNVGDIYVSNTAAVSAATFRIDGYADTLYLVTSGGNGGQIVFHTNSADRMSIDAAGNVGIGAPTNVSARLVVATVGDRVLNVRGDPASFGMPAGLLGPILQGVNAAQSATQPITLFGSPSINLMGGPVGAGCTSPQNYTGAGLVVINGSPTGGPSTATQLIIGEGSFNAGYCLRLGFAHNSDGIWKGSIQNWHAGGGGSLLLNPLGGSVGIGTSTPFSRFSFGNADPSVNCRIAFFESPDGTSFRGIGMANPSSGSWGVGIWAISSGPAPLNTNTSLFVHDSGNVGIGTGTNVPQAKLSTGSNLAPIKVATYDAGDGTGFGIGVASGVMTFGAGINIASGVPNMTLASGGNLGIGIGAAGSAHRLSVIPTAGVNTFALASQQVKIGEPSNIAGYALTIGYGAPSGRYGGMIQAWDNGAVGTLYLNPSGGNIVMANSAAWGADTANMPLGTMMIYYNHTDGRLYFYVKRTDSQTIRQTNLLLT